MREFLGWAEDGKDTATKLWYFYTGELKDFADVKEYAEDVRRYKEESQMLREEGKEQFNLFGIGGILSVSPWRARDALSHVPPELARFLGIELEMRFLEHHSKLKKADKKREAKKTAFDHGLQRNPFALFRLADKETQEAILRKAGLQWKHLDSFVYDDMSQALQRLVYQTQQDLKDLIYDESGAPRGADKIPKSEINDFIKEHSGDTLDFSFSANKEQLEKFVNAIRSRLKPDSEDFKRLVRKEVPFNVGTDDLPMEIMRFVDLGDIALQRRYRDLGACAAAVGSFRHLIDGLGMILQKEDSIVNQLVEIYGHLSAYGAIDKDKHMMMISSRILDLVKQDRVQKWLPWPLGNLRDTGFLGWANGGLTSEAEKLFGQHHMSLDREEMRMLVERIISTGIFGVHYANEARNKLYERFGLQWYKVVGEKIYKRILMVPVGLAALIAAVFYNQLKEALEETAKEA